MACPLEIGLHSLCRQLWKYMAEHAAPKAGFREECKRVSNISTPSFTELCLKGWRVPASQGRGGTCFPLPSDPCVALCSEGEEGRVVGCSGPLTNIRPFR